jgi:hypothetical protein
MTEHRFLRRQMALTRRRLLAGGLAVAAGGGAWWWLRSSSPAGPAVRDAHGDLVQTVPRGQLPDFVQTASAPVRKAYRYALEHGETLQYIPCFCGCVRIGHRSNRDCYMKAVNTDQTVTYTSHGAT